MTTFLFHRLQKGGPRTLTLSGAPGFEFNLNPFMEKVVHDPCRNAPFPVFVLSSEDAGLINERVREHYAELGLGDDENGKTEDREAAVTLATEDMFKMGVPAQRFGLEVHTKGVVKGLLFEAMRHARGAEEDQYENIPYTPQECAGMKISECNFLRIHFLDYDPLNLKGNSDNGEVRVCNPSVFLSVQESLCRGGGVFVLAHLNTDACYVSRFDWKPTVPSDIFGPHDQDIEDDYAKHLSTALNFLWVLDRDPELITRDTETFAQSAGLRKRRGLPPYSPVHTMCINQDELRRREFRRAQEIACALSHKGRYSIPGLVLVAGHVRPSSGKAIQPYARCEDKEVRMRATELLRVGDYKGLAVLVREFGAKKTKDHFGLSPVQAVRLVPGS